MEGNKGAWLSVFDFTYMLNVDRRVFELEAGRLPIAPKVIGEHNPFQLLIDAINNNIESHRTVPLQQIKEVAPWNKIYKSKLSIRPLMNQLRQNGIIVFIDVVGSRAAHIDVEATFANMNAPSVEPINTTEGIEPIALVG